MKPTPPFTTHTTDLSHEGRGIAHIDGKLTFIDGALAHETVNAVYTQRRSKYDEAKAVEILHVNPDRVAPPCRHFDICGGCSLQHMHPTLQITHKQSVLANHLRHFGSIMPESWLPPLLGPSIAYRRKARLGVRFVRKKNRLLIGFRETNGRMLADIEQCEVLDKRIGQRLTVLRDFIATLEHYDHIPQIEVAAGDDNVALIIRHMQPLTTHEIQQLCTFAQQHAFWIYLQPAGTDSIHKIWPATDTEQLSYRLTTGEIEILFHPADFTQVNADINQQMVAKAIELLALSPSHHVLDLFCGLGNFTLPIARFCQQVTGIEGEASMTQRAAENARHNHIENARFFSANLFGDIKQTPWFKPGYDRLLLDPPRLGAQEVIEQLQPLHIPHIVYISCNPATLARDAGILVQQGYRLTHAGVMDMFPHTKHVESIAVFSLG